MFDEKAIEEIKNWFKKVNFAEFELPDRHFGRPGDCSYGLKSIYTKENQLFVEILDCFAMESSSDLELPMLFIFQGSIQIRYIDDYLDIYGFQSLIFQRQRRISSHSKRLDGKKIEQPEMYIDEYDEGTVRFMPDLRYNYSQ